MNRLISLALLVVFAAQHLMCCCTGTEPQACNQRHFATEPSCVAARSHVEDSLHHCQHEHSSQHQHDTSKPEGCPCDHSHQHHFCIGSHVFFVSAPRAEVSLPVAVFDFALDSFASLIRVTMVQLSAECRQGVDACPPLASCPQRSELCVYLI